VSIDTAAHALDGIRKQLSRRPPLVRGPDGRTVQSLQTFLDGSQESMLRMLLMASLFFLFLACAGIASLLLAQSVRRRREMILRVALGSSRSRLVAQLLADTFLIVCAGGAVGLLLGSLENQWLHSVLPDIGVASIIAPSSIVLVVGLCFGVTIVCGLAPAWRAARANIGQGLKATAEFVELPAGRVRLSYRELLAGVQLMLALALLIGASLLVRTLVDRTGTSSGVKTTDVVTFSLELPRLPALLSVHAMFLREHGMDPFGRYGPRNRKAELGELVRTLEPLQRQEQERNRFFFDAVINRVKSLPAIVAVAAMDPVPFTKEAARPLIRHAFKSKPLDMAAEPSVRYVERRVSPGAFTVLSMPFINGRPFTGEEARDGIDGARPAVINEALARSLWPGQSPLGQHFFDSFWPNQEYRVMGVVANDQFAGVPSAVECSAYVPFTGDDRVAGIVAKLRPGVQDGDVQEDLSRILADIPPRLPRPQVQRLDTLAASSLKDLHLMVALLTAFSVLGAVVAALGVYGTVTLIAAARAKEMAIRLALGGSLWRVRGLALWQGLRMASAAIPIGLLVGWILATNLARSVPMHTDGNLLIYGASSVLVSGIAVLAGLMPVLRIDPIKTAAIMRQP
jgi:hypothetical protein